jgi:hypothetical protein
MAENNLLTEAVLIQIAYILMQKVLKSGVYADTKSQKPSIPFRNWFNEILLNGKSCLQYFYKSPNNVVDIHLNQAQK